MYFVEVHGTPFDEEGSVTKKSGSSSLEITEIQFTWKVYDFYLFDIFPCTHAIKSPPFTGGVKSQYTWQIIAYPKGLTDEDKGRLTLHLCLLSKVQSRKRATCRFNRFYPEELIEYDDRGEVMQFYLQNEPVVYNEFKESVVRDNEGLSRKNIYRIECYIEIVEDMVHTGDGPDQKLGDPSGIELYRHDMSVLFESPKFCDVSLVTCGKTVRAHKVILAARSPVFAAMFSHDSKELQQNRVDMDDNNGVCIDYDVLMELLRYIYTGKAMRLNELADSLLTAADKYQMDVLKADCEITLCNNITPENAVHLLILGDIYSASRLRADALDFICIHALEVWEATNYQPLIEPYPHLTDEVIKALAYKIGGVKPE